MKQASHNQQHISEQEILTDGHKILTRKIMQIVDRKYISGKLGIHESLVSHWLAGNKAISTERMYELIKAGKSYCQDIAKIEDEIDLMMILQFGRAGK